MSKFSIRFSGAGTHGLIQVARILAEAAAIYDDKIAIESCSYGPEARGNASRAEVIISDEPINYPKADKVNCLIVLTQEAYDKYAGDLFDNGTLIAEASIKTGEIRENIDYHRVNFIKIAAAQTQKPPLLNMIALGYFSKICCLIKTDSIEQAILARIPKEAERHYIEAFKSGRTAEASK